jgi:membrane-associated phospholipid phosphatase
MERHMVAPMARRPELVLLVAGLAVLAVGAAVAGDGTLPDWEESAFRAVNDLPGWLYRLFWPGQILGALFVVPIVAVAALVLRQYWLALAVVIVGVLKLVSERIVKAVVTRERPGTSVGSDINVRGDVSVSGESFVSGHAILAAGIATVIAPYVSSRGRIVLAVLVVYVMFARIYVGAHNLLDVICGAGLGVALGVAVNLMIGAPRRSGVAKPRVDDVRTGDVRTL